MSMIYQLFQQVRELPTGDNDTRQIRAAFVAQAYAFQVPLDPTQSLDANLDTAQVTFRTALSQLNEYIAVDTRLAQRLYEAMLKARYDVLTAQHNPTLMYHILTSETQQDMLTPELAQVLRATTSQKAYRQAQQRAHELMSASLTGE